VELDPTAELTVGSRDSDPRDRGEIREHAADEERDGRVGRDRDVSDQVHPPSVATRPWRAPSSITP